MHVKTNGNKYWRMNYKKDGKAQTASFGKYLEISLQEARQEKAKIREVL